MTRPRLPRFDEPDADPSSVPATEQDKCHGCGRAATTLATVPACDSCRDLMGAALSTLQPEYLVEPNTLSPARRGALRRAREIGLWAAQVSLLLAREDLTDDQLKKLMDTTSWWWAESQHSRDYWYLMRNELIATLLEVAGKVRRNELDEGQGLEMFARSAIGRWPELEGANGAQVAEALHSIVSGRPRGGQWPPVRTLLVRLGVISDRMDEKSLAEQFHQWLNKQPAKIRELVGVKRRPRS